MMQSHQNANLFSNPHGHYDPGNIGIDPSCPVHCWQFGPCEAITFDLARVASQIRQFIPSKISA